MEKPQTAEQWNRDKGITTTGKEKSTQIYIAGGQRSGKLQKLIQQARQETAREIFEEIEKIWGWQAGKWGSPDSLMTIRYGRYQELKSKYLEGK